LLPNIGLDPIPRLLFDAPFKEVTFGQLLVYFLWLSLACFANIFNPFFLDHHFGALHGNLDF
jgi:hypothetical protein